GNRSAPGISSAAREGRKAQCHPSTRMRMAATATSSTASAGDAPPGANIGNARICRASAAIATAHAIRCSGDFNALKKAQCNKNFMSKNTTNSPSTRGGRKRFSESQIDLALGFAAFDLTPKEHVKSRLGLLVFLMCTPSLQS